MSAPLSNSIPLAANCTFKNNLLVANTVVASLPYCLWQMLSDGAVKPLLPACVAMIARDRLVLQ
jgi:hypothetical protein